MPETKPELSEFAKAARAFGPTAADAGAVFGLPADQVLAFKLRDDDTLVVVTIAGQKHTFNPHDPVDVEAFRVRQEQRLTLPVENSSSDSGEAVSTGTKEGAADSSAAPTAVVTTITPVSEAVPKDAGDASASSATEVAAAAAKATSTPKAGKK